MMIRERKYILFIFLLAGAINPRIIASAEETATEGVMVRPVMEYMSDKLRDPFKTCLVKEEPKEEPKVIAVLAKPSFDLSKLQVQGIIWGGKTPQAIINDKVLTLGDLIEGAEIVGIEKKGITLSFNGVILDLNAPGQNLASAELNKKDLTK